MGSIREKLQKRWKDYETSQRENRQRKAELEKKEKAAYDEAYAKSRVATARQRGAAAGRQGGGSGGTLGKAFSIIQRVGEGFIGTAEAMYPQYAPRRVPQRRKTTKRRSQKKKSKRDPYLEDLLGF